MIGSPRSKYKSLLAEALGVAIGTDHRESMKGMVGVRKSFPCLDDTSTRPPRSFYLGYPDRS
jgi:hypothetical protein